MQSRSPQHPLGAGLVLLDFVLWEGLVVTQG